MTIRPAMASVGLGWKWKRDVLTLRGVIHWQLNINAQERRDQMKRPYFSSFVVLFPDTQLRCRITGCYEANLPVL